MIIIKKLTLWLLLFWLKSSHTRKGQAELLVTNDVSCARGTCFFWWWWWGIEKGKDARFLDKLSYLRSIWSDLGWTFRSAETTCNLYARLSISTHLCHQLITKWSPNSQKWLLSFSLVNYQNKHLAPPPSPPSKGIIPKCCLLAKWELGGLSWADLTPAVPRPFQSQRFCRPTLIVGTRNTFVQKQKQAINHNLSVYATWAHLNR